MDLMNDTIKAILLSPDYEFDGDNHSNLSTITSYQLSTGNGYVQNDKTLTGATSGGNLNENTSYVIWDDISWTASGGSIGPFGWLALYNDTDSSDRVVGCARLGKSLLLTDGAILTIRYPKVTVYRKPNEDRFTTTTTTSSTTTTV